VAINPEYTNGRSRKGKRSYKRGIIMFHGSWNRFGSDQKGITGLETAIILIAFVVVASVFAYTILSAGIYSSEKGKEAIHSGLSTARASIQLSGPVLARDMDSNNTVDQMLFVIANSLKGAPMNLVPTVDSDSDGLLSDESPKPHSLVITYLDQAQMVTDIAWTATEVGKGDGDFRAIRNCGGSHCHQPGHR
jgi:flagellin FlaB